MADSAADAGRVVDMADPVAPRQPPDNLLALRAARAAPKRGFKKTTEEIKLGAGVEASLPQESRDGQLHASVSADKRHEHGGRAHGPCCKMLLL